MSDEKPMELFWKSEGDVIERWWRNPRYQDQIIHGEADEVPPELDEDAPLGWCVFDGTVGTLTAERLAEEDHPYCYEGEPMQVGDEWWQGRMREATAAEVCAFFRLPIQAPEVKK